MIKVINFRDSGKVGRGVQCGDIVLWNAPFNADAGPCVVTASGVVDLSDFGRVWCDPMHSHLPDDVDPEDVGIAVAESFIVAGMLRQAAVGSEVTIMVKQNS